MTPSDAAVLRAEDAASRRAAQTAFDRPLVLEAGAGTGKTTVLVARLLVWCLGRGWEKSAARLAAQEAGRAPSAEAVAVETLRRVVAITFTEAAAAEMATRVGAALLALRRDESPLGILPELLPEGAVRAERARALLDALDQLIVRTIHAWCRRLLVAHPIEAGVHPRFTIDAEERLQAEVVREVVESWLVRAGTTDDPDLLTLASHRKGFGPLEIERALLGLVKEATPPEALEADPLSAERMGAFCAELRTSAARFCAAEVGRLLGALPSPTGMATARAAHDTRARLEAQTPSSFSELEALVTSLRAIWSQEKVERLRQWARKGFGTQKSEQRAVAGHEEAIVAAARDLDRVVAHLISLDLPLLQTARRVLAPLLAEATRLLRARGIESYAALLRDARDLLRESPAATTRLRGQIDQLLVDEFQDTDAIQCEILRRLVLDAPAGERPGLFLVGDPKQSIYGWRSADLRAYDAFLEEVRHAGAEVCRLSVSFRSVPEILEEVERAVAPLMHEAPGLQPRFQPLVSCDELAGVQGFRDGARAGVEHWVSWGWDEETGPLCDVGKARASELEAAALARDLVALRAGGVALGEVAILLRGLADAELYLAALRDAGIPFVVERDRHYYERREVSDAVALVRCLLDPNDHLALVTVLRSPLVGVPDAAWLPLWRARLPDHVSALHGSARLEEARAAVRAAAREVPGDVPGLDALAAWPDALEAFLVALGELRRRFEEEPPDRFVEALRALLVFEAGEAARHLGAHRVANLDRLLRDLVAALEETGGDAFSVLARLRHAVADRREAQEGRPRDAGQEAVSVLTIHGAKGLDFGHVYVMQCHKGPGDDRDARSEVAERRSDPRGDVRFEYVLLGAPTLGFHGVARDADAVEVNERLRLLYVALTRAKRRLVVAGKWPEKPTSSELRKASHADLLASQRARHEDLVAAMRRAAAAGLSFEDRDDARFRFPALELTAEDAAREGTSVAADEDALPGQEELRAASDRLVALHEAARRHEMRPFFARATAGAGIEEEEEEDTLEERFGGEAEAEERRLPSRAAAPGAARREAQAAGTLVHHVLEALPFDLDADATLLRVEELLLAAPSLGAGDSLRAAAEERARKVLTRFVQGSLFASWRDLEGAALARELPVLAAPAAGAAQPVGFVSGAVDLLYREPATGDLVVVDYKTDELDEAAARERAETYRSQGEVYTRALQRALGLATRPRFELWFLHTGQRVRLQQRPESPPLKAPARPAEPA